jgi:hypothetical protein
MGFFADMFGGGQSPSDAARPYFDKIPGQLEGIYGPYMEQGQDAYRRVSPIYDQMMSNPAEYLEKMMGGYTQSKGYGLQRDEALRALGNSAAAGGMRGTLSDMEDSSRLGAALQGQDMQQWLQNVMGIQGQGMGGMQNIYQTGAGMAPSYAGDLSNATSTLGQLAYNDRAQKLQNRGQIFGNVLKMLGTGAGAVIGGMAGGPMGAAMGGSIGGSMMGSPGSGINYQPFSGNSPMGQGSWRKG